MNCLFDKKTERMRKGTVFVILLFVILLLWLNVEEKEEPIEVILNRAPTRETFRGIEVFWKRPPSKKKEKGLIVMFHGCNHDGIDWFQLPEEKIVVENALRRNFVVVSMSSSQREGSRCWDTTWPPEENEDVTLMKYSLKEFIQKHRLEKLPRFAVGGSSGGYFETIFLWKFSFDVICVQVASGSPNSIKQMTPVDISSVFFVTMVKDFSTTERCKMNTQSLQAAGIASKTIEIKSLPISSTFFSDKISSVNPTTSEKFYLALLENKKLEKLEGNGYYLNSDPRTFDWKSLFKIGDNLIEQSVNEVLNVAWASHEFTSEYCDIWLDEMERFCNK